VQASPATAAPASPVATAPASPAVSAPPASTSPAVSEQAAEQAEKPAKSAAIPHELSPWSMFMAADILVKSVMIGLVLASLATWTIFIAKTIEFSLLRRRLNAALTRIGEMRWLAEAKLALGPKDTVLSQLFEAATHEVRLSEGLTSDHGINERAASSFAEIVRAEGRRTKIGMGLLATIGAISPFVGLFGTVWGIMNSFIGISKSQTTNLAVVAPGIAEALLATAFGLAAAIPAVIIYNHFTRTSKGYMELVSRSSGMTARLLSRDLDRSHSGMQLDPIHVHSAPSMALAAE
jgi:biopolymer transport protein ExbB